MKTITKHDPLKVLVVLIMTLVASVSCVLETQDKPTVEPSNEVTFTIHVPQSVPSPTRAITQGSEDDVALLTLDLLLFDAATDMFITKVTSDRFTVVNASVREFKVSLPLGSYNIMILANSRLIVNSALSVANAPLTKNKSQIHELLTKTLADRTDQPMTGVWNSKPGSVGYETFSMWSETSVTIPNDGVPIAAKLIRMLAKVNLSFATKAQSDRLAISSIMVVNYNKSGYVASNAWNLTTADGVAQPQSNIDEKASRMEGLANGLTYANVAGHNDVIRLENEIQVCRDEIFLPEIKTLAVKPTVDQRTRSTALIIKGRYNGATEDSYYRVNFSTPDDDDSYDYLSLLRNHVYSIVIQSVNTAGHPTPEIAYNSFDADLSIGIATWNEGGAGEIAFDGQYTMAITPAELNLYRDATMANTFVVMTDYPQAPTVSVTSANWISNLMIVHDSSLDRPAVAPSTIAKRGYMVTFDAATNGSGAARQGNIDVRVGKHLDLKFRVNQSTSPVLTLRIDDITPGSERQDISTINFSSGLAPSASNSTKKIRLTWAPYASNNPVTYTMINSESHISGSGLPPSPITGGFGHIEQEFSVNNFTDEDLTDHEFATKTRLYTFYVSNGLTGIYKSMLVTQTHFTAVKDNFESFYAMDGEPQSFSIRSNTSWKVDLESDEDNVLQSFTPTSGSYNSAAGSGRAVNFTLKNMTGSNRQEPLSEVKLKVTCTDPTRYFEPFTITITGVIAKIAEPSNSYMLKPNGYGILIPISRANGHLSSTSGIVTDWSMGQQITASGTNSHFGTKLLWTESNKGVSEQGAIAGIRIVGTGSDAHILVVPGSSKGNSLVAAMRTPGVGQAEGTGDILWSWHIWVVDYYPYDEFGAPKASGLGHYWMARNLGALTNTLTDPKCYGLFYQWGRKDPFPTAATIGGTTNKILYDRHGVSIGFDITKSTGTLTTAITILNPMTRVKGWWTGCFHKDNYTALTESYPWDYEGKKTIFDPCPHGYRVPRYHNLPFLDSPKDWGNQGSINLSTGNGTTTPKLIPGGIQWDDRGGDYPRAGYIVNGSGNYAQIDSHGYGWTSTSFGFGSVRSLHFSNTNFESQFGATKADAGSVRCITE